MQSNYFPIWRNKLIPSFIANLSLTCTSSKASLFFHKEEFGDTLIPDPNLLGGVESWLYLSAFCNTGAEPEVHKVKQPGDPLFTTVKTEHPL